MTHPSSMLTDLAWFILLARVTTGEEPSDDEQQRILNDVTKLTPEQVQELIAVWTTSERGWLRKFDPSKATELTQTYKSMVISLTGNDSK